MTHLQRIFAFTLAAAALAAQPSLAQTSVIEQKPPPMLRMEHPEGAHMVANGEVAAILVAGEHKERITGRISLHLVTAPESAKAGRAAVRGFNLAFFGVPQRLLADQAASQEPLGMLGFSVSPGKGQALCYDAEKGQVTGELQMYADASFLNAYAEPSRDGKGDLFDTPVIPVTASVRIDLDKSREKAAAGVPRTVSARFDLQLQAREMRHPKFAVRDFTLQLAEPVELRVDLGPIVLFEVAQRLCVQPVRLMRFTVLSRFGLPHFLLQYSGDGLAFGEPAARSEWAKADVVFTIRDWKTLAGSSYWVLDSTEADALRTLVDDDDCIEVFFVHELAPQDMWGGGATWGSGTASAKVISSDGNARGGVDFTHLGHELGHVLGLRHPDAAPTASAQPASTGTLMCPSGYLNDNPHVNSQENEDRLSNPLLTFAIKPRGAGPDCVDGPDCGACP